MLEKANEYIRQNYIDEKEKPLITVSPYTAIVRNPYSDLFLRLISDEERGIFAIAYGSRMIPRRR